MLCCSAMTLRPQISTLFPYTTLFRSADRHLGDQRGVRRDEEGRGHPQRHRVQVARRCGPSGSASSFLRSSVACRGRSEEHTSELQSRRDLVCRLLLEKKNINNNKLPL